MTFYSRTSSFHPHIFPCIFLHDTETKFRSRTSHSRLGSFRFSIRIKFSFSYDISFLYHVNWKRTPFRDETVNRVVWGEWRMRNISCKTCGIFVFDLARKLRARERLRLSRSILSSECSTNFILERNSFRNETHSVNSRLLSFFFSIERARATLRDIGPAVFNGGFSTFLAVVLLAFSNSYVFKTFFKVSGETVVSVKKLCF